MSDGINTQRKEGGRKGKRDGGKEDGEGSWHWIYVQF